MNKETFWIGYGIYAVIQGFLLIAKIVKVITVSWWSVFIPTIMIAVIVIGFLVYFLITCNPRIEKHELEEGCVWVGKTKCKGRVDEYYQYKSPHEPPHYHNIIGKLDDRKTYIYCHVCGKRIKYFESEE